MDLDDRFGIGLANMDHTDILNTLATRFNYFSYLEIGVNYGVNFKAIDCVWKIGDPMGGIAIKLTSDQFFAINNQRFDLIFIDGLHHADQVFRDIEHALSVLNEKVQQFVTT